MKILMIGVLGLFGVYLRYAISIYSTGIDHSNAFATFFANSLGCLIAGIVFALIQIKGDNLIYTAILIGLCGGLTTFSGYNLEFLNQINKALYSKAFFYFLMGPFIGMILISLGYFGTLKTSKIF